MHRIRMRIGVVILALIGFGISDITAEPIYLAIGDSSAYGETNRTRNPSNGDRGYVAPFANFLGSTSKYGGNRPQVLNLAINGETTSSYFNGLGRVSSDGQGFNTNYNGLAVPYAQQQRMNDLLGTPAQAANVKTITVQLGANNLDAVASQPDFLSVSDSERQSRFLAAFGQIQSDYINILTDLKSRFADADLYVMGYHNPYNGDPTHPFYNLADPAVRGLNQLIWGVGENFGAKYVDVYGAVNPYVAEMSLMGTWKTDPVNYVHLNDRGYSSVSARLIATAGGPVGVPEPTTLVLASIGGFGALLARRTRERRKAATESSVAA